MTSWSPATQLDPQGTSRNLPRHGTFHTVTSPPLLFCCGICGGCMGGDRPASSRRWCLAPTWELPGLSLPSPLPFPTPNTTLPERRGLPQHSSLSFFQCPHHTGSLSDNTRHYFLTGGTGRLHKDRLGRLLKIQISGLHSRLSGVEVGRGDQQPGFRRVPRCS